jgi:dTMP kinase
MNKHPWSGKLISFDGIDGCGKSTQAAILHQRINQIEPGSCVLLQEPGGTPLGQEIRQILLHTKLEMCPRAEALLFMASRAQLHYAKIRPLLAEGKTVVTDRWAWSTMAYQTAGGVDSLTLEEAIKLTELATGRLYPDLSLILDIGLEDRGERLSERLKDRIESRSDDYTSKVLNTYRYLAHRFYPSTMLINARESREMVAQDVWRMVSTPITQAVVA